MDGLERAVLVLTENQPRTVPRRESHVVKKVLWSLSRPPSRGEPGLMEHKTESLILAAVEASVDAAYLRLSRGSARDTS